MKRNLSCLAFSMLLASPLIAQMPVISTQGKQSSEVYLQTLNVQVDVVGNIASTKFTMTFKNRTSKVLEGDLLFPLADGATVSSYALDINGKMRDAVPVEKAKATQVFEEIEQRRVDPGLLERVEGNNFRTRIYPIPSNGSRTITIGYEQELLVENGRLRYSLPMDYKEAIEKFSLKATVLQSKEKPVLDKSFAKELTFDTQGTDYVANFSRTNYTPSSSLEFSLPASQNIPQVVMQSASGSYYFVASYLPKAEVRNKKWDKELGIIWDVSLSGLQRDRAKEIEALGTIMKETGDLSVTLYFLNNRFSNAGTFKIKNGDWAQLRSAIENAVYDGGTNFSAIKLKNSNVKEVLFFTDGISTLSDADFSKEVKVPVHCIVSSVKADYSSLKLISAQTKGKFVNLNALSLAGIQKELMYETLNFLGVETPLSIREVYPSIATPVTGNFSVAGILNAQSATVTLLFGYGNKVESRAEVKLDAKNAAKEGFVHRIWAQKKINELDIMYEKNKDELIELGSQFGIVTRNTSLIVLETIQDYITYGIVPPDELRAEYMRWKKNADDSRRNSERNIIDNAIQSASELKTWWDKDFTPKKPKYPKPDEIIISSDDIIMSESFVEESRIMDYTASAPISASAPSESERSVSKFEVQAEIGSKDKKAVALPKPKPTITLTVKQDNEYVKQLSGNAKDDYKKYLVIREEYISTPAFYFYMADWFFKLNDKEKALSILTSIADIDLENASLFRLLGYRLKEYGEYNMETYICNKVIMWRPMDPQSYRDYALALADAGKHQEAINCMYDILNKPFASNIINRSMGIDEVIVTELNQLISAKTLDHSLVNKELIKTMPVDIRVVLNWNMNNTDIDLHVKDPYGVTCYYSNKQTEIGGRISHDITGGYGPEQFMLKKAPKGKYEVFVNYFSDTQVKAEGPSTLMLEIFTNYSNGEQERQVVCVQLSNQNRSANGLLKVAEFVF